MHSLKYLFGIFFFLLAPMSFALGLGEASLHSAINQPLLVRVPILGIEEFNEHELKVKIASPKTFEERSVERTAIHGQLQTRVVQSSDKTFVIEIYTRQPYKDAWINFLLDFRWPKGNIVKDVNLLLDLPQ